MAREATVAEERERERERAEAEGGRNRTGGGTIELAGRKADEIIGLLRDEGYDVAVKKLVPVGPEASLTLEVAYSSEPSLFDE